MDCSIEQCNRDTLDTFCDHHLAAQKNIQDTYSKWTKSLGKISKVEYYNHLINDEDLPIGIWAKEMATHLLSEFKN